MKKALTIFIVVLLVMLVGRFVVGGDEDTSDIRILKLAHGLNTQHPVHKTMVYLAEQLEKSSEGKLIIQIFPSEQLGNEKECIEALQLGYLAMTKTSTGPMEGFVPRIKIFGLPYVFRDSDHFWKFALGPIGKELLAEGQDKGLKGLCYYDAGARSFYAKKPINTPADLKGLKIRVMSSIMAMKMVKTMGGSPTPISYGELYSSLDSGVVDAAENNPPSFDTSRHFEICKYYSLDEHVRLPDMLVISTRVWESLDAEQQELLQAAVDDSVTYGRKLWVEAEKASLDTVKAGGVEIIYPDKTLFQKAAAPMWKEFEDTEIGPLIKQIQEIQ